MVLDALRHDHELLLLSDNECRSQNSGQDKDAHPKRGRLRKWLSGWKFTLSLASAGCIIVLSFNFGFLFWAVARDRLKKDRGVLYEGDCDRVRHLNTGLHLLINLLSTALLGASNYGMVCETLLADRWRLPCCSNAYARLQERTLIRCIYKGTGWISACLVSETFFIFPGNVPICGYAWRSHRFLSTWCKLSDKCC